MLLGLPNSAICVQRFDDSLNSAIRITYRISLRSSSMREPRYPLLRVVLFNVQLIKRVEFTCETVETEYTSADLLERQEVGTKNFPITHTIDNR